MAAKIVIARGAKANKSGGLSYGELFWQKTGDGELGTLYIGKPDGASGADLAIGGARSMESLFYQGTLSTGHVNAFPSGANVGDFWIMGIDGTGALAGYNAYDWVVCIGASQFTRVNNSGGSAADTSYDDTTSKLGETTVQDAINELALTRLQYAGTFDASSHAYPTGVGVKPGQFYLSTSVGTVSSVDYKQGDAAFYDGTTWAKIPLSLAFPADGIEGSGTVNYVPKYSSSHGITDSNISDSGSKVTVAVDTKISGTIEASELIVTIPAGLTTSGDPYSAGQTIIQAAPNVGGLTITLPSRSGTLQLTSDKTPASQVTYDNASTSLIATTVQAALTEMAQGKMSYAGTISSGTTYPATPIIGGLYLLTADLTLDGTIYDKGDWAFYDPEYVGATGGWTRIPAGYTKASDISFDYSGLFLGDGTTPVSASDTTTQLALADLFANKADLVGGYIPTSQLPSAIVGGMTYRGTWDASSHAYPTTGGTGTAGAPALGNYWIVSVPGTTGGVVYTAGDLIVYDGSGWQNVQGGGAVDAITVGSTHLQGDVTFAASGAISVTPSTGTVTIGVATASKNVKGVVQVGDGIAVSSGTISVDATGGLTIDSSTKKLMVYLNANGLTIDSNQKLGINAGSAFTFGPVYTTSGDLIPGAGKLILANTGVGVGTYTKVAVNAQGQVTSGSSLLVADVPITASGETGATEIYNSTTGAIAGLKITGPVGISKSGDAITLDFTQTNATTLVTAFATTTPVDFDWTSRSTFTANITSLVGAVNANREDMDEYISLLRTQGATTSGDPGAGANLVGTAGISGVTPTGKSVGGDANLQQMLEGLAAYTNSQIAAAAPNITGTPYNLVMFDGAGTAIVDSSVSQNTDTSGDPTVTVAAKLQVGTVSHAKELDVIGIAKIYNAAGTYYTQFSAPTGVAGGGLISTTQAMPDQSGQLLNDNSTIDGGVY
jgi:hypothetical protein